MIKRTLLPQLSNKSSIFADYLKNIRYFSKKVEKNIQEHERQEYGEERRADRPHDSTALHIVLPHVARDLARPVVVNGVIAILVGERPFLEGNPARDAYGIDRNKNQPTHFAPPSCSIPTSILLAPVNIGRTAMRYIIDFSSSLASDLSFSPYHSAPAMKSRCGFCRS